MQNSIEEITFVENKIKNTRRVFEEVGCHAFFDEDLCEALEHILQDYKRVLKENERISSENGIGKRQYEELVDDYEKLNLENNELKKENEELKQDRNNNNEMVALARNEVLNYMTGYEDGKKHKMTATAQVVENQQYYIIQKQMEKYEEHIKRLQKENKELRENYICAQANANQVFDILKNYVPVQTIKAKIEELDIEISTCEYADDDSEEYKQEVEKDKAELLMAKKVLQQLLEESEWMNDFDLTVTKEDIEEYKKRKVEKGYGKIYT